MKWGEIFSIVKAKITKINKNDNLRTSNTSCLSITLNHRECNIMVLKKSKQVDN